MAEHCAGQGVLWEIWNESNIKIFWKPEPNVDDYCKLVNITAPGIKKADKTGMVVAPATSTIPLKWIEDCFKRGILDQIDALTIHPYRPHPPETVIKDYARLRDLIKRYAPQGKKMPVISGEWGYSNINWDNTRLSNEKQAQYLAREFLINLYQKIPVSIWYDWKNDGTNPDEREHHFGTVMHDLKPKTAYLTAKVLSSTLAGYSVDSRLELGSDKDFALRLTKGKKKAIALWTMEDEHQVTLPIPQGQAVFVEMLGKKRKLSWPRNGLMVMVSPSPQYLLLGTE